MAPMDDFDRPFDGLSGALALCPDGSMSDVFEYSIPALALMDLWYTYLRQTWDCVVPPEWEYLGCYLHCGDCVQLPSFLAERYGCAEVVCIGVTAEGHRRPLEANPCC